MKYYSKATGGLYDDKVHKTIPEDAIEIDDACYNELKGKTIVIDSGGNPISQPVAPSPYHKWSAGAWVVDADKRLKIIDFLSHAIDQQTAMQLANGLDFANSNFPLIGDAYSHNMAAASAYIIGQGSGGRELLTNDGSYVQVDDIAGLVASGDQLVTSIIKNAVDEKAALQAKKTEQLIELLNT